MSLDDLPARAPQSGAEPGTMVRRVGRPSPLRDKVTGAEELRLQLADEIVRGALQPGTALDETELARRFAVSRTPDHESERSCLRSSEADEVRKSVSTGWFGSMPLRARNSSTRVRT